jgi:hypothetical protein
MDSGVVSEEFIIKDLGCEVKGQRRTLGRNDLGLKVDRLRFRFRLTSEGLRFRD